MRNLFAFITLITALSSSAFAQTTATDLLNQKPNFLKTRLKATDSLFVEDLNVLKKHIAFDSVDNEILKPQLLYTLLSESDLPNQAITYQTVVNAIEVFKRNIGYTELRKGIILYKQMASLTVNPQNWAADQTLFKRLGFTEADLEDFLLFITKPENKQLNYKEAYLAYMKEIDNLQQ